MKKHNSTAEFMFLYQSIYHYLRSTWNKDEHHPSSEAIAVLNHLILSGPLTISEAALHFNRSQSAMSELVDRLQANGYVDRLKDSRDKRKNIVWLTKKGRDVFDKTQEVLDRELLNESINMLSENERANLLNSMKSLASAAQTLITQKNVNHDDKS